MNSTADNEFVIKQFLQFGRMVLHIAFQNTCNMTEAEDITQEVFLKLMMENKSFQGEEHIKAWLIRVTINQCKDINKSARTRKNVALTEENLSSEYYEVNFNLEDKQVFEELSKLPSKYKNVIYLYYYEEYTVPEIAKILDTKENTVSSWLTRAKRKLKMELEMEGENSYGQKRIYCSNAKN